MKSILCDLSRRLPVADILGLPTDGGLLLEPDFTPADMDALTDRLGVLHLGPIAGQLTLKRWRGKGLSIRGALSTKVTQACVLTVEPVEQDIAVEVDMMMFPGADPLDMDSDVDPLPDDVLMPGEIMVEHIALAIDPYPRKPGAEFAETTDDVPVSSPFAALGALKDQLKSD